MVTTKEALHRLIDQLSDSELETAQRLLEALPKMAEDPLLRAFMEAPEDDEPLSPEDEAAIEEGKAEIRRGEGVPWEIARTELLGGG